MKKSNTPVADAALTAMDAARRKVCCGTAAVERIRELLVGCDLDDKRADRVRSLLAGSLERLYAGAAEMQAVRAVALEVVENCEILQGSLRQLRTIRREEPGGPPFPDEYFVPKTPDEQSPDED